MIDCPSSAALRDLLSGALTGRDADTIRDHLGGCVACLDEMDRLSDDPEFARWMAEGIGAGNPESTQELIRDRLRAARDAPGATAGRSPELDPPCREGDIGRLGPYHIEAVLGRGGMGIVLRAFDESLRRVVALKVIQGGSGDEKSRARFVREARAAALVEHDHIVRIYAVASPDDGPPYLAMEYLDGSSLAEMIRDRGRLAPREAARIAAEVGDGLAAAHAAGLVHRDIKPANILFDSATGRAKIVDFGLARSSARPIIDTEYGSIGGTPAYLSPEQARGEDDLDGRSDLYNLGVTLYEALTGELPFRGSPPMVLRQVLADEPKPPRRLVEALPRDLETICLKAMAKEPGRRYPGAAEFAADLRRWLGGEPIRARPVGPVGRAWLLGRRHPRVLGLSAALALAMVLGVAGVLWQWRRAEANAREANHFLRKSLDSIDGYFVKVSENRLLDVPNLQPLRKELLESARGYYESLLRDRPHDPAIRTELAKARSNLAAVVSLVGSRDEAIALFRLSLAEFDRIIAESPRAIEPRYDRLACLTKLARVQVLGSKGDDARETYRMLLAEGEALRRERPGDVEPTQATYSAHHGMGSAAYFQGGDPDRMIADFERALGDNRDLLGRSPDHPAYLRNLSRTAGMLAVIYRAKGRPEDADKVFEQGYGATRRLVASHPDSQEYRFALAALERTRGRTPLEQSLLLTGPAAAGRLERARECFDRAIAIDRRLLFENPRLDAYRLDLIEVLLLKQVVESGAGRVDEGLTLLREAAEVASSLASPDEPMSLQKVSRINILVMTGFALADAGRIDEARKSLDEADRVFATMTPGERSASAGAGPRDYFIAFARASILWDASFLANSVQAWDRACELAPTAARPLAEFFREVRRAETAVGPTPDPARALIASRLVDEDRAGPPIPGCALALYAKTYALAAPAAVDPIARELLDARAVFCLEKARESGFFRVTRRLDQVLADPAFARLANRPDHVEFRRACQAGGPPTAR